MFNFKFIGNIAKQNPALARAIEMAILAAVGYALGAVINQEVWSMQACISSACIPLLAFINKRQRDLTK